MISRRRQDEVNYEQAINEEYLREAKRQHSDMRSKIGRVSMLANAVWTGTRPKMPGPNRYLLKPLIGRVVLGYEDQLLGSTFYVGSGHTKLEDTIVLSWAAKSAGLLFEGRNSSWHDPDPQRLSATRTFRHKGNVIDDFVDDIEPGANPATVFADQGRTLDIPALPVNRTDDGVSEASEESNKSDQPKDVSESTGVSSASRDFSDLELSRAHDLVIDAIRRPRSDRLHSVLSTIQSDQYRFVTWPATEHLAVQGHPGTGKTIVATHRAAYLTNLEHKRNPEQDHLPLNRVGLVGPTDKWASYVRDVLDDLGAHGVDVISMQRLIRRLSGGLTHPLHHRDERYFHSHQRNAAFANETARRLKADLARKQNKIQRMQRVADEIIRFCRSEQQIARQSMAKWLDEDHRLWIAKAGNYDGASRDISYLLFLAASGAAVDLCDMKRKYQHLIVDEVQDLRPVEWWILSDLMEQDGRWSLFGDMNQRRSDFTHPTWEEILRDGLELELGDTSAPVYQELSTGYRSTRQILKYASRLLQRHELTPKALRDGPEPTIRRVGPKQLIRTAFEEVVELADEFSTGITAVIAWDNDHLENIRKSCLKDGWRQVEGDRFTLRDPQSESRGRLHLARPVFARGLEFDGVVVVEPADFQKNLGRHGSLYTALTRANQRLVLVYSKALPKELKKRN